VSREFTGNRYKRFGGQISIRSWVHGRRRYPLEPCQRFGRKGDQLQIEGGDIVQPRRSLTYFYDTPTFLLQPRASRARGVSEELPAD
jgi:hypothetical protein